MPYRCPKCKNTRFVAHQVQRTEVCVDEYGEWDHDYDCYDAEKPYGPFTCDSAECDYTVDELNQMEYFEETEEEED